MSLDDILRLRWVKAAEQSAAKEEEKRPVSPWWNSKERWDWEKSGRKR
jgi:hypothetical protein